MNKVTGKHGEHNEQEPLIFEAMNTSFYITVQECRVPNWQDFILGWIKYVEHEWSRFQSDNALAQINNLEIGEIAEVSPPLFDLLSRAEEYRQKSNGFFSPYLLPLMEYHGYSHSFPFQSCETKTQKMPAVFSDAASPFHFDEKTGMIERLAEGQLDLGGIAKGYAVEAAANWLKSNGKAAAGIVDGGGDMTVWSNNQKEWKISVAHPYRTDLDIAQFRIKNGAIATSNVVYRSWLQGNEQKHHLLNGRTGLPVNSDLIQATVITENCVDAEVMAKLCFMVNEEELDPLLNSINPSYTLLLVTKDGKIIHHGGEKH